MSQHVARPKSCPQLDNGERRSEQLPISEILHQQKTRLSDATTREKHCTDEKRNFEEDSVDHTQNKLRKILAGDIERVCSPYFGKDLDLTFSLVRPSNLKWRKIKKNNLDLDYTILFPREVADALVQVLENEIDYFTGALAKIKVFGKWHDIPRKQVL